MVGRWRTALTRLAGRTVFGLPTTTRGGLSHRSLTKPAKSFLCLNQLEKQPDEIASVLPSGFFVRFLR